MLGSGARRPVRDLQYHRAKSLTSTLLGRVEFFRRHSEVGTSFVDMKLLGSSQQSGRKKES